MIQLTSTAFSEVELLQRKIRKMESQLRRYRKANPGAGIPLKGQTGKHTTRLALVQSVLAAIMAGRSVQQTAAAEGVSPAIVYKLLKPYGGAVALRKRKA